MLTITELQSLVTSYVNKEIEQLYRREPGNLYAPMAYALEMGGKRLRPVMVLLGHNLFADEVEEAIHAAMAVEIFHNFTLLHDDIMDQAELRRNLPSVYKKYNQNIAILSGDAMSIIAFKYLQRYNQPEVFELFTQTALEVCEGQQLDMDFEQRHDVTISQYIEMIKLKTAVLLACCLKLGALTAHASEQQAHALYEFGLNLGIAFQLQDDLLDVFADQRKFGKKIGGDIVSNKKTFLLLKALELADPELRTEILRWISLPEFNETEKVKTISEAYKYLNVREITEAKIAEYYQKSISVCNSIDLAETKKAELIDFAQMIMNRDH